MGRLGPWAVLVFVALVGGAMVLFRQAVEIPTLLKPTDQSVVALGKQVYANNCMVCHGEQLQGQPNWQQRGANGLLPAPPHDASGHTWHHPSAYLIEFVKRGPAQMVGNGYQSAMGGYEGVLTDNEIVAVLSYIKSTWSARIQRAHNQMDERFFEAQQKAQGG